MLRRFQRDPILRQWIQPQHLRPEALRAAATDQAQLRYAVVDDFFRVERLEALRRSQRRLRFHDHDAGLNYDAASVKAAPGEHLGAELFYHRGWHDYAAAILDCHINEPGATVVKLRRHGPRANGFWVHTDRCTERPRCLGIVGYFNKGWAAEHGGLLQLWRLERKAEIDDDMLCWPDYVGRPLSFLVGAKRLSITAAAERGLIPAVAHLIDEIVPVYNRVIFIDFQRDPAYHSVTPSNGRTRQGFVQWLR